MGQGFLKTGRKEQVSEGDNLGHIKKCIASADRAGSELDHTWNVKGKLFSLI